MAVEFLTDEQAAGYGTFAGTPSRAELERYFFLDDTDRELIQDKRRDHNRLGFAVQLTSVRFLGRFMADPRQVPAGVAEYLAEQLGIADASCLKLYGERDGTARTHAGEIQKAEGWRDFAEVAKDLREWVDARAWTTGDGPKALFDAAAGWLRERRVLLPGFTTLERLVGSVREAADQRLWDSLYGLLNVGQRAALDWLLPGAAGRGCRSWTGCGTGRCGCRARRWCGRWIGPPRSPRWGWASWTPRGAAAAAGGVVAVRDRRQGLAAAAAQRFAPVGHAAGDRGASDHALGR